MRPGSVSALDRIDPPPAEREFLAGDGSHRLVITAVDPHWRRDRVRGRLERLAGSTRTTVWEKELPHSYGPRFAAVGRRGTVLLVDEWINVASTRALQFLDAAGELRWQRSFDEIAALLGVPRAALPKAATSGAWVATPPRLDGGGKKVSIGAAGRTIEIDLDDGSLVAR